jgi:DNA-binding NarL/FixJ family response regulator
VGTPSIGLITFPMLRHLYQSLDLEDRISDPQSEDFEKELFELVQSSLNNSNKISEQYQRIVAKLHEQTTQFIDRMHQMVLTSRESSDS